MDGRLAAICSEKGVFLRSEAADLGYDDKAVTAAVRQGAWHRVRRGAYTLQPIWSGADLVARHQIRCRAVLRSMGPHVALSHTSAVVELGIATWGVDLRRVHVTRLDGRSGGVEPDVVHHEGVVGDRDLTEHNGLPIVAAPRAVVEAGSLVNVERGLVIADSALHRGAVKEAELAAAFTRMTCWPGTRSLQIVMRLADGRAESPGESRVRFICWEQGLPKPDLQYKVFSANGRLVGITDFAWPAHRLLGEFDGRGKYGRLLAPGRSSEDAVFAEKTREDRLRELTGWSMIRFVWTDLEDHAGMAARARRLMLRAA